MQMHIKTLTGKTIMMTVDYSDVTRENSEVTQEEATRVMKQWHDTATKHIVEWLPTDEYKLEIEGPRRIGKSTLAAQLPTIFPENAFLFVTANFDMLYSLRADCLKHNPRLVCWHFQAQHMQDKRLVAQTMQGGPTQGVSNVFFIASDQIEALYLKKVESIVWPTAPELVVVVEHWNTLPWYVLNGIIANFAKKLLILNSPLPVF